LTKNHKAVFFRKALQTLKKPAQKAVPYLFENVRSVLDLIAFTSALILPEWRELDAEGLSG